MSDASFEDRQHRSPERASRPGSGVDHSSEFPVRGCPSWCAREARADHGTPDEFVTHISAEWDAGTATVHLRQVEFVRDGVLHPVFLWLDEQEMPLADAAHIAATLLHAVGQASTR